MPWLPGQKSCSFLRELYQRDEKLRALAALARVDHSLFSDSGYHAAWDRLVPADKAVLRALAQDVSDLHSLTARFRPFGGGDPRRDG
jgi:hypothetical protein